MAKFCGKIGYAYSGENPNNPGEWINTIIEKPCRGEDIRVSKRNQERSESAIDNVVVTNQLKVVANAYLTKNFANIVYVIWRGQKLKVTDVTVGYPCLTLTLGGVYNG